MMKPNFRIALCSIIALFLIFSCKKENKNIWETEIETAEKPVEITNISKEFYDENLPLQEFQQKYPWFQGTVSNEDFLKRKTDSSEIKIYQEAINQIDEAKLQKELTELFARVKHYFPNFVEPKVFLFSSALQMATDPIFLQPEDHFLFIDITGFMGENHKRYEGLEQYYQKSMNPRNIVPKVSEIIAENMVPVSGEHQKFIDHIIYYGKIMTLQDAFLPSFPENLKIGYTPQQYDWAKTNEANIWNYFVENDLLFSDDARLQERFIAPGPFSKFYTQIDNESSPQIAIFIGWQICKSFYVKHSKTPLQDFMKMSAEEIFNKAGYKP
ncbi:MAG: gliding motility protein GldB [Cruoricaptor ignavus]|nr:gliding motility protein GldB [Cruoricaptor ignavus]